MAAIDFTSLSPRNAAYGKVEVAVANGATFVALDMGDDEKARAANVLYIHVHRQSRRCYLGITVQEAAKRWLPGAAYKLNPRFGRALQKYGWAAFDSYILAFAEDRDALNMAEVAAIAAAGGHKTKLTFNLSPGGDMVAENDKPLVGVHLPSGKQRTFKSGAQASRLLGMASDMATSVARGEKASAADWWFRFADDAEAVPPKLWGEQLRFKSVREKQGRAVVAVNFSTGEQRDFPTVNDAAAQLGVEQSAVSAIANGAGASAKGWWFRFADAKDQTIPALHGVAAIRAKRDRKIYATNLASGEKREFRNCTVADAELGIYKGAAAAVAAGERVSAAGWWFSFSKDAPPPAEYKFALVAKARSKAVVATDLATGAERTFSSAKEAAEALGISRALISYVISGKRQPTKYGFRFA